MTKYINPQHVFFCVFASLLLILGVLLSKFPSSMLHINIAIFVITMLISNQVIFVFNRYNAEYREPNNLPLVDVPGQNVARNLMLAAAFAQYHFPWEFNVQAFLNSPNLLSSIFFAYVASSIMQIWLLSQDDKNIQ